MIVALMAGWQNHFFGFFSRSIKVEVYDWDRDGG